MSVDPSHAIETFGQPQPGQRRRRRHSHRTLKHHSPARRRFQRIFLLCLLGVGVVFASLYIAQNFTAYKPPTVSE